MIPARTTPTARLAVSTALVTAAVLASMLGLRTIVLPPWPATGVTGVLLVAAAVIITRALIGGRRARVAAAARAGVAVRRVPTDDGGASSVLPTLAGIIVAAWFLLARFGGVGGRTQWLVGPESASRLVDQLGAAGDIVREEVAPVIGTTPTALLCVGGALVVLIAADALASGLRQPMLAAGSVLVLWLPPLVLTSRVPTTTFVVSVAAFLLGLTLDAGAARRAVRDARVGAQVRTAERRRAVRTTATAAAVTALALVVTAGATGPGLGRGWTSLFTTTARTVRLADDLDMYRSLTARSTAVVLTYTSSTGESAGPLRLLTLSSFDGRHWSGGPAADGVEFSEDQILFPQAADSSEAAVRLDITVGSMRENRLPVTVEPRTVTADGGWRYDAGRDEVVGGATTQDGDTFTLVSHPRDLSPQALRAAPAGAREVDSAYLSVPATRHVTDIEAAARQIVGDAATDFDRAVALQNYLRDTTRFTYDVDVPRGQTGDAVWDFLQQRRGYCVQFATTMVTLARTLGVPARLAVGYLPGANVDRGARWEVTGQDSHAWPELYFPGSGWVRFEPTPAIQTGAAPAYTNTAVGQAAPTADPTFDERAGATSGPNPGATAPSVTATAPAPRANGEQTSPRTGWLVGVGAALLAGGGLLLTLWLRRRATRPPLDAEDAWARVAAALGDAGVTLRASTTPRQAPREAAQSWAARTGQPMPADVRDALTTLADALETERYAVGGEPLEAARLAELTREVTAGVSAAGRAKAGATR